MGTELTRWDGNESQFYIVIAGLVPAIHNHRRRSLWMAGTLAGHDGLQ